MGVFRRGWTTRLTPRPKRALIGWLWATGRTAAGGDVETPSQEDVNMAVTITGPRLTRVAAHPASPAGEHYRAGREHAALAPGFAGKPGLNLHFYGGRTLDHLTFTN